MELFRLFTGTMPAVIAKITYFILLNIFLISIINWTYRRTLCIFDAGWASYSIGNLYKLIFCIIFLLLSGFSLLSLSIPSFKYQTSPFIIFLISINILYCTNILGSAYITDLKKPRIITNTILAITWELSIAILYFVSIKPTSVSIPILSVNNLWGFGITLYKKINPFFIGIYSRTFNIFSMVLINFFNFSCLAILAIFTFKIPKLKAKLTSIKYLIIIDILSLVQDTLYYFLSFTTLLYSVNAVRIIGYILAVFELSTYFFLIKFIQKEGSYDKNLKKSQIKSIKKDIKEIIQDFENIGTANEYIHCKKRLFSLQRRISLLDLKLDILKYNTIKNPELKKSFIQLVNETSFEISDIESL